MALAGSLLQRTNTAQTARLRALLAQSLGEEGADSVLGEFGGSQGQMPVNFSQLSSRIGARGDENTLRFRGVNKGAADFALGANRLQNAGVAINSLPPRGAITRSRPISGQAAPLAQQGVGGSGLDRAARLAALRRTEAETSSLESKARQDATEARLSDPLGAAKSQAAVDTFRGRQTGGFSGRLVDGVTQNGRPGIQEAGDPAEDFARSAENAALSARGPQDPGFDDAGAVRKADLMSGTGPAGASPGVQTALINAGRDEARGITRTQQIQLQNIANREREELRQTSMDERQINEIVNRNHNQRTNQLLQLSLATQNALRFTPGTTFGFGPAIDPAAQEPLDEVRASIDSQPGVSGAFPGGPPNGGSALPGAALPGGTPGASPGVLSPEDDVRQRLLSGEGMTRAFTQQEIEQILADPASRAELGL